MDDFSEVTRGRLQVHRPDGSPEKEELMTIRAGSISISCARELVNK